MHKRDFLNILLKKRDSKKNKKLLLKYNNDKLKKMISNDLN